MNITIKPWKPGDGGLICLPLRSNIPDASKHPDWRLVTCPSCGRECWEPEPARQVKAAGAAGVCTECALRAANTPGGGEKKAAELHMVAYATYQLSLRIDELNNSKTKKEDPENEENKRTE